MEAFSHLIPIDVCLSGETSSQQFRDSFQWLVPVCLSCRGLRENFKEQGFIDRLIRVVIGKSAAALVSNVSLVLMSGVFKVFEIFLEFNAYLQVSAQEDKLTIMDTRKQEMDNSLEEMKYELEKAMRREFKLDFRLAEVCKCGFSSFFWKHYLWSLHLRKIVLRSICSTGKKAWNRCTRPVTSRSLAPVILVIVAFRRTTQICVLELIS